MPLPATVPVGSIGAPDCCSHENSSPSSGCGSHTRNVLRTSFCSLLSQTSWALVCHSPLELSSARNCDTDADKAAATQKPQNSRFRAAAPSKPDLCSMGQGLRLS